MVQVKTFFVSNSFIKNQCYLVYKGNSGILIDPAWDFDLIHNFLTENQIVPECILLTHSHPDHTNLAERFSEIFHLPVFMSNEEICDYGFDCNNLQRAYHLSAITTEAFTILPILTPGHTSGSMCYLIDGNIFSGDTIFIEGVGVCLSRGSDVHQLYDSVQFLKYFLPESILFWPGHSFGQAPGQSLKFLLENNIYFQIEKEHFVRFRMRKNQPNPFLFN